MTETRPHELSAACWCDPGPTSDDRFLVHSDGAAPEQARDTGGLRKLEAEYNVAIANGLVVEAKHIHRRIEAMKRDTAQARDTGGLREALAFTHSAIHSGENCNGKAHDMVERALSQGAAHEERGLDAHPDDGHEHSWGCRRCGVDPSPSQLAATLDLAHPAREERGLDEHALHYDADCEECVYLARPSVLRLPASPEADEKRPHPLATPEAAPEEVPHSIAETPEDH